ncbi:autotransporter outer membrane beta-barrel domain-containing protein [Stenotrophomonas maltophilia]|uniref:autotransporter family protein n=1 Tax=Stenotrophomonas maltophilia TaxID=40324 RepID=UPI000C25D650|nr:autotransporter outer membrane beta-barrel domain-containing protein [Stenotrophomonas maltophilia]PJL58919.1 autotransporter outer membrane beta-barrel domain-containing protein [Stenotrophomonas maltophilia]
MKIAVRHSLALAIAAGIALAHTAQAGSLGPGQGAEVNPGDTPETWVLNGAGLNAKPGARLLGINATNRSDIIAIGTSIEGRVNLTNSSITLIQGTLHNTAGPALSLTTSGGGAGWSIAFIERSTVSGAGFGGSATQGAALTLDASRLEGTFNSSGTFDRGIGFLLADPAHLLARNGSTLIGDDAGITASYQLAAPGDRGNVEIDASRVEGRNGAGIHVVRLGSRPSVVATFNFRNGSELIGGSGTALLVEDAGAVIDLNLDASRATGGIVNAAGGTVDVALSNGASITGVMTSVTSATLDSATWNMTGNSTVGALSLGNGTVSLGDGSAFHTLNVAGNFSGADGTIVFNTLLAGDDAATDRLVIGGDTSGTANVRVNNVGGAGAQTHQGIQLIQVGGASNGQFNLAGRAVGGQYEYFLHKGTGTDGNWYLRSQLPTVPDPCVVDPRLPQCRPIDPVEPVDPIEPEPVLRPEPGAYLANLQAAQNMFRLGYHDRHAGQNSGRAWARVDGSRNGFDAVSKQLDIRGNSQALTVGADLWRHDSGSSAGVVLSSGNATSTSTNELTGYYARGKVKGEALGLYGTLRGGNGSDPYAGFYVDGSVQRAQFRNRVEGIGLAAERYDSRAWQGAVETGYAFRVGGARNGGLYLEPQLQVGYTRWDSNRHTEANGTVVGAENANGLFGRAGLRLSGVTRWGNGSTEVQPYLAAHWLHTRAESQIRMDDEVVDARIPRSRGEFSAGASLKFSNGIGAWGGLSLQHASGYHQTSAQVGMSYHW